MTLGRTAAYAAWALTLTVSAACAPLAASDSAPAATPRLIGSGWRLSAYSDAHGNMLSALPGTQVTATFGSNGFVTGSGGCNAYSTVFQAAATTLLFGGPVAATHSMCEQPVMDQEETYFRVLPRSSGYRFEGDHLVFVESAGTRLLEYGH